MNLNPLLPSPNFMSLGKALLISVLQTRKVFAYLLNRDFKRINLLKVQRFKEKQSIGINVLDFSWIIQS